MEPHDAVVFTRATRALGCALAHAAADRRNDPFKYATRSGIESRMVASVEEL